MNTAWLRPILQALEKHAPHILMGFGTVGSVTSVIFASQAAKAAADDVSCMKADKKMLETYGPDDKTEEYDMRWSDTHIEILTDRVKVRLTPMEWIKTAGKYYIPAAGMLMFSMGCFWAAHGINVHRQAIMAGLYSTAQEALAEYQKKVKELIGKDAEKEVHNAIAQDKVDKNPPPTTTFFLPDSAQEWWSINGQYFPAALSDIKRVQNEANWEMIQHMYLSEAELYWLLDPMHKYLKLKNNEGEKGWNLDRLLVLEHDWATDPRTGRPVGTIRYVDDKGQDYPPLPGYSSGL